MTITNQLYVLDDDSQYAHLLAEVAMAAGWETQVETNPVEFLTLGLKQHGVLVLDLVMPEMDGIEVINALAERHANLSLILISGFDTRVLHSAQQFAEAHNLQVVACLTKPFAISEFKATLKNITPGQPRRDATSQYENPIQPSELSAAIKARQLVPFFQPQINLKTGALHGVEVLVRWQSPDRGLVFPDQFIPLAEANGLMDMLTDEVIRMSINQVQRWHQHGWPLAFSINVSADNVTSLEMPEHLERLAEQGALDPKKITIELTETAVMGELTSSLNVLNRLRMKGFNLSIDDFGTGYSSLSHLYNAPFTELKVDRKFVGCMLEDQEAMVIVKICVMLGKMLGMKVVAEGAETAEIWHALSALECDIAQGYFIAKPMNAESFEAWVEDFSGGVEN